MDGGGFSTQNQQPQRAKGVTPLSGDFINKSTGQGESLVVPLTNHGEKKLGKVVKYIGVFKELLEEAVTHFTASIDDSSSDLPVKCIIQGKQNNKGSRIDFDSSIADSFKNHHVCVLGYINSHIDHGRVLNVLDINLVKTPWQYLAHQFEVALQIKNWKSSESNSGAGGMSGQMASGKNSDSKNNNDQSLSAKIMKIITDKGENESWGCHRGTVHEAFEGTGTSKNKIDQIIAELVDEGVIYNTLDDDNFKSSDQQ